ncbi:Os09g0446400 [Oryza sativa Japonica Group]|uniref:Os09g0446400 protein n=1 Tax=Oryza sativa subsp. japonica TaxID=39947 RepID=Q0J1E2_ORYSJ|nr:Os09g0446400 [Oryza sativa Japonica Group]|eukprot:NP_001063309.1 Os09g0446400 [Oryza sativa Japonica Group]
MESGARDAMESHFGVGSGSPSCHLDGEPVVVVDSTSVEAAALDHVIITVDAGVGAHLEHPSTPQPKSSVSIAVSCTSDTCNTHWKEHLKPMVGMIFDTLTDVEKFYKSYAHKAGFSVRVAHIVVKLGSDKKYRISSMVEEHNHGFVSLDKRHLLRSNRNVSERAKSTLFSCHKASIGTSQAYRLLHVSEGGFENVGCTKRDLQNYYRDLRTKIKDADAQIFVAQLERKKEVNPAFFYDFMVDEQGRLVRVFWADALCRKNYSVFGDVVSVDSTYTTNQYNMIFVPFTGVNHHLQSVFLGAAFLANEKIESYVWLFKTFLKAMRGVAPHLIITDEDMSMKAAIAQILPDTAHRLCMWHIMEKVPEKVGPTLNKDEKFWDRLNKCVWGFENSDDFESQWNSIITDFGLMGNDWFSTRELLFDDEGNLLDEKPKDPMEVAMQKKISVSRNKFEDLIQMAKNSEQGMDFLHSSLSNLVEPLQKITPATRVNKQDEYESFLGSKIPNEINIHPPNDIKSKGRCKRIRKSKEKKAGSGSKGTSKRKCRKCKQVVDHDARNCPNNVVG